jgi:uncharacterized protein (DUF3820 family)
MAIMTFGKHKGVHVDEVPILYLVWLIVQGFKSSGEEQYLRHAIIERVDDHLRKLACEKLLEDSRNREIDWEMENITHTGSMGQT